MDIVLSTNGNQRLLAPSKICTNIGGHNNPDRNHGDAAGGATLAQWHFLTVLTSESFSQLPFCPANITHPHRDHEPHQMDQILTSQAFVSYLVGSK